MIAGFIRWIQNKKAEFREYRRRRKILDRLNRLEKELRRLQFRFEYLIQHSSEARNTDAINRQMSDLQYAKKLLLIELNRRK